MPDEIPASAQTSPEDGPQGQKMTIYMPQGAVIIERTGAEEHAELQGAVISENQRTLPITANEQVQSAGAVINIYAANDQSRGVNEGSQPVGPTGRTKTDEQQALYRIAKILDGITERATVNEPPQPVVAIIPEHAKTDEHQILYRIVEILDGITKRMDLNEQAQPVGAPTLERTTVNEPPQPVVAVAPEHASLGNIHRPNGHYIRGYHLDWLHAFNIAFIAFIAFVAVVPALLLTYFGIAIYASSSTNMNSSIYQGDLMISELMPVSRLNLGDVVLLRNEHTWDLEVRQVTVASTPSGGDLTTITTETEKGAVSSDSYILNSATPIHKITSVIPKFGDLMIILTSILQR